MRILALDIGQRRIGVAISDPTGTIARPLAVLQRRQRRADMAAIADLARRETAQQIVVGLPLSLSGETGPQARSVLQFTQELISVLNGIPVVTWDERYSTVEAQEALHAQGINAKQQRRSIDMVAAAMILQSYLDNQKAGATPAGPEQ